MATGGERLTVFFAFCTRPLSPRLAARGEACFLRLQNDRWSRYCVLDEPRQVLEEDTVATTGRALRKLFSVVIDSHRRWLCTVDT